MARSNLGAEFERVADNLDTAFDDALQEVRVVAMHPRKQFFGAFHNKDDLDMIARAVVAYPSQALLPITIGLALDRSGSMKYASTGAPGNEDKAAPGESKMEVLKESVQLLVDTLEDITPDNNQLEDSLRMTMAAYNRYLTSPTNIDWGYGHIMPAVSSLVPDGGTNGNVAVTYVGQEIFDDRSFRAATQL